MFKTSIRSRVIKVINEKIKSAQAAYDTECEVLDMSLAQDIERLEKETEIAKDAFAESLIKDIIKLN